MVPSFREKAIEILNNYSIENYVDEETIKQIELYLLDAYTLGLNQALKAIDKWSENTQPVKRFNTNNKTENK